MTIRTPKVVRAALAGGLMAAGLLMTVATPANAAIYQCVQNYGAFTESWEVKCYDNGGAGPHEYRAKATCTDGAGHFQTEYGVWKLANSSNPPKSIATCDFNWFLNGPGTNEKR